MDMKTINALQAKLEKRLAGLLMEENSLVANGFNTGIRTMFNYALIAAYELKDEGKEAV